MSNLLNYHFTKEYIMNLPKEATNAVIAETIKSYERGPFLNKFFLYGDYKAASVINSLTIKEK